MQRDLFKALIHWKNSPLRKPLVLRGARQVGKSWLINEFGKTFSAFIKIDFDKEARAKALFTRGRNLKELIIDLEIYAKQKIIPKNTLLFLDEIQECPDAIHMLRQFKEDRPDLYIIVAGSLVDFILDQVGMPVGRVQFMYLYPLSFGEFLTALGREDLRKYILEKNISLAIHQQILALLKHYLFLGGMPAVIDAWINYQQAPLCQALQEEIISAYAQDFYKYAKHKNIEYVTKVFEAIPTQLGRKLKFSNIDNAIRSMHLKAAFMLLVKAGIVYPCFHTAAHTQPLGATQDDKKFKAYLFDVGLAQRMLGLVIENWHFKPLALKTLGGIAEQFVAQELIAYRSAQTKTNLYYWHREAKSSNAEVDFIIIKNQEIIPIEVKAGSTGHLRSLKLFLESHPQSTYGLKISENVFSQHKNITEIPLYGIEAWCNSPE